MFFFLFVFVLFCFFCFFLFCFLSKTTYLFLGLWLFELGCPVTPRFGALLLAYLPPAPTFRRAPELLVLLHGSARPPTKPWARAAFAERYGLLSAVAAAFASAAARTADEHELLREGRVAEINAPPAAAP